MFFDMKRESIFKTPRRGLMGSKPLGAEYMPEVNERARRMKAAIREEKQPTDDRQLRLPGFMQDDVLLTNHGAHR